jgi:hypothetical protein
MDAMMKRRADCVTKVKMVLAGAGVPPRAHAKTLAAVIGVAIAQAYRKLSGASPFTLPQLEAFELAYGVQLVEVRLDDLATVKSFRKWTDASFVVAGHKLPCRALIESAQKSASPRYVAYLVRGEWQICLAEEHLGNGPVFDVEELALVTGESEQS